MPKLHKPMASILRLLPLLAPLVHGAGPDRLPTVHCVVLATPNTYEPHLLAGQWRLKAGIFECDSFDIYSNVSAKELFKDHVEVADALASKVHNIGIKLFAPMVAGPPGWDSSDKKSLGHKSVKHLANTPIFETFWNDVCNVGHYRQTDFTVKVDTDTVLLPARLASFLWNRKERAEYFFNSDADMYGNFLHGPIELLSKGAMSTLCKRAQECKKHISQAAYGEDFYMNECLKSLGVPAVKGMALLYDKYSYGTFAKEQCTPLVADKMISKVAQAYASYHPRKDIRGWIQCRREANEGKVITDQEAAQAVSESKLRQSHLRNLRKGLSTAMSKVIQSNHKMELHVGPSLLDALGRKNFAIAAVMLCSVASILLIVSRSRILLFQEGCAELGNRALLPTEDLLDLNLSGRSSIDREPTQSTDHMIRTQSRSVRGVHRSTVAL